MSDFQDGIKKWVEVDNKIKILNEEMKLLRGIKTNTMEFILDYAEDNNLQNAIIEITDGKLKFQQSKTTKPLTFKFLESCLHECIKDENQVKQIVNYVKKKREIKYSNYISRTYS
jgi:hypothetical protein